MEAGSVFVYSGSDRSLLFRLDGTSAGEKLGGVVLGVGDGNADGIPDIAVGAPSASNSSGLVRIYSGATGVLFREFSRSAPLENFGAALADVGDLDGDGRTEIAIGAPWASINGFLDGAVFTYSIALGTVMGTSSGGNAGDEFGTSIQNIGDWSGDGIDDLLIGAPGTNRGSGSAFVYEIGGQTPLLTMEETVALGSMGASVTSVGDISDDGIQDFLIGSTSSTATLWSGADGTLLHRFPGAVGNSFGFTVATVGDLNGDHYADFLIGDYKSNSSSGGQDAGSVYVEGVHPYLVASRNQIPSTQGGVVRLLMDFPPTNAGQAYQVMLSATGIGPSHVGIDIPLTIDNLTRASFAGSYPFPQHSGLIGSLDGNGNATAFAAIPALGSAFIDAKLWLACLAIGQTGRPDASSRPVQITITP